MKFRPCIDLHQGKVKQLVGSSYRDGAGEGIVTNFATDASPATFAEMYRRDGLVGGHVIMLGPGNEKAALDALLAYPGGLQVGGGITPANAAHYLESGASHVIVTSYVFHNGHIHWDRLRQLKNKVGREHLVLDLSCKWQDGDYFIVTDRWQCMTEVAVSAHTLTDLGGHCAEFLIHAAHIEGMRQGIDESLVALLGATSPVPVTYAGGIRSLDDLARLYAAGKNNVDATIGSALDIFGGSLAYRDVVAWAAQHP